MGSFRQPQILKRIAFTLTLGLAFIIMASIFTPDRTRARDPEHRVRVPHADERSESASADAHAGLMSLGVVEAGRYAVTIFSTDMGPRYTVVSADTGEELGTLLSAEQVMQLLPEIDLNLVDFSMPTENQHTLMLAEPQV